MLHLAPTKRFTVISRSDATVPRIPLAAAASTKALQLLKRHGYFVATDLGAALENDVASIETELDRFFAKAPERKEKCMGTVYANERGLPMFRRGYERQQHIRECFRVPVNEEGQPGPLLEQKCAGGASLRASKLIRCVVGSGCPGTRARRRFFFGLLF